MGSATEEKATVDTFCSLCQRLHREGFAIPLSGIPEGRFCHFPMGLILRSLTWLCSYQLHTAPRRTSLTQGFLQVLITELLVVDQDCSLPVSSRFSDCLGVLGLHSESTLALCPKLG